jgi:AcrR family transcriptional regulator
MKAASPSVDELLLHTLERFTGRVIDRQRATYAADASFAERWRTAVVLIEQDLATGYPKVRGKIETDALDALGMRERLKAVADRWRALLREALAAAIDECGLACSGLTAEKLAAPIMQFGNGLLLERLLGLDRGHAGLLAAIDNWLTSWETT